MTKAGIASRENVMGSKMATVAAAPIPGNTPTNVPIKTPTKQTNKLYGVKAVLKPLRTKPIVSILYHTPNIPRGN